MNFRDISKFFIMSIILMSIDSFYLSTSAPHFKHVINRIQGTPLQLKILPTVLCYILLIYGLYYFIIKDSRSYIDAGLLGFFIYAVFELTNKAIFDKWSWITVIIDSIWGGILFSLTTYLVYTIYGTK